MFEIAGVDQKIQSFAFGKLTVLTVNQCREKFKQMTKTTNNKKTSLFPLKTGKYYTQLNKTDSDQKPSITAASQGASMECLGGSTDSVQLVWHVCYSFC